MVKRKDYRPVTRSLRAATRIQDQDLQIDQINWGDLPARGGQNNPDTKQIKWFSFCLARNEYSK